MGKGENADFMFSKRLFIDFFANNLIKSKVQSTILIGNSKIIDYYSNRSRNFAISSGIMSQTSMMAFLKTSRPISTANDEKKEEKPKPSSDDSSPKKSSKSPSKSATKSATKIEIKEKQEIGSSPSKSAKISSKISTLKTEIETKTETDDEVEESPKVSADKYDPSASNYSPVASAFWRRGESTPYFALATTFKCIEATKSRLEITRILCNVLRSVVALNPSDLIRCVYLCLNRLGPTYDGLELGVADAYLMKALAEAYGRKLAQIKKDVEEKGDLGIVAESSRTTQKTLGGFAALNVANLFQKLKSIAQMTGNASQAKKVETIKGLLVACRGSEARYLIRCLAGKLRIGLAEQTVLTSLANALSMHEMETKKSKKKQLKGDDLKEYLSRNALILKTAYCQCPNYDLVIEAALEFGIKALPEKCTLSPGVPLLPMLAHPSKGTEEILRRFGTHAFTCEWKYDGERAQIHYFDGGKIKIFSRNQEDNSGKYPDIVRMIPDIIPNRDQVSTGQISMDQISSDQVSMDQISPDQVSPDQLSMDQTPADQASTDQPTIGHRSIASFILDTEVVAWDIENKSILPFQILSTRKRKGVNDEDIKVQVCLFAFDILYFDGQSLVERSLRERREILRTNFRQVAGRFVLATSMDPTETDEVQTFLEEAIKGKCEGLMVKTLDELATYEIAKRSHNWLKLKKDYLTGIGDTLDLVVMGAYFGTGKRTGVYGGYLLGCYEPNDQVYQSICKIGTGFSDEDLRNLSESLKSNIIQDPKRGLLYMWDDAHKPDVWFEPVQVWEVKAADFSLSPKHYAALGLVEDDKGISLRFPRFIRLRDDKNPEDATSAEQVAEMYRSQEQVKHTKEQRRSRSRSRSQSPEDDEN